jgi:membrane glycosyltransferase
MTVAVLDPLFKPSCSVKAALFILFMAYFCWLFLGFPTAQWTVLYMGKLFCI